MRRVWLPIIFAAVVAVAPRTALAATVNHPAIFAAVVQEPAAQDTPRSPAQDGNSPRPSAQETNPTKDVNVDINVQHSSGGVAWYRSPLWIAVGAIAIVVLALIVALIVRGGGGGTTIVRE